MSRAPLSKIVACVHGLTVRFMRKQDGSAAVEFSIVAIPFLALIFAIMETALVFFAGQTLETAVADASRLIMTGSAQNQGWSKDDFKTAVCAQLNGGLFDCANKVLVDVRTYASFSAVTNDTTQPTTDGQLDPTKASYSPGIPGSLEVVRLYYQWPIYVSQLGYNLANSGGNARMLMATAVFCNEPFSTTSPSTSCKP
jgi:Flp pilus assembly protein TadG